MVPLLQVLSKSFEFELALFGLSEFLGVSPLSTGIVTNPGPSGAWVSWLDYPALLRDLQTGHPDREVLVGSHLCSLFDTPRGNLGVG